LPLVLLMLASYVIARRLLPRYAVPVTLVAGVTFAAFKGQMAWSAVSFSTGRAGLYRAAVQRQRAISLALPLFVVTMASQNLPGVAVMRATGYDMPVSRLITMTGLATLVLAPFGAFALNFSAITAAICMGPKPTRRPEKRYTAAVSCGAIYTVIWACSGRSSRGC
jgi:benzoate membrane transport protein